LLDAVQIGGRLKIERIASERSLRALDWLNFFKADAQTTVGPYLAIFLMAAHHWDVARIGMAMAVPGLVTVFAQTPAGALIDWIEHKRALAAVAALGLAAGCLLFVVATSFAAVVFAQGVVALASIMVPPAIAAISVGLVGHRTFARRMGRNEAYSHAGAVAGAAVAGSVAYWIATSGLFYCASLMSMVAGIGALSIREEDIDPALTREAEVIEGIIGIRPIRKLIRDLRIIVFTIAVILFHLANAAMLPLLGESLSARHPSLAALHMSACIIVAQLVMTPVALVAGRLADSWGRKRIFLIAFASLPIRGLLFAITANPYLLVSIQILDGVGAGIFGVVAVIVVSDLAQRTGRFNLMQGAMSTCVAIGGSLSNLIGGFAAQREGFEGGFTILAIVGLLAFTFFWAAMPETGTTANQNSFH
jgi:MFS family permease